MYKTKGLFKNVNDKWAIINNIKKDYLEGKSIDEITENYSFSKRQIRYIIEHYIKINRREYNKSMKNKMNEDDKIIKIDDDNFMVGDKPARKATIDDLLKKAKLAKKEANKSTTKQVVEN